MQVVPLVLLIIRVHIADGHEENIDEHRQDGRQDDVHDTRREAHVTDAAVADEPDYADENDQAEQHMAQHEIQARMRVRPTGVLIQAAEGESLRGDGLDVGILLYLRVLKRQHREHVVDTGSGPTRTGLCVAERHVAPGVVSI